MGKKERGARGNRWGGEGGRNLEVATANFLTWCTVLCQKNLEG
jgi:hypothetical protein